MTKGRIYFFDTAGFCHKSTQFQYDMHMEVPHGHGTEICAAFLRREIKTPGEFRRYLKESLHKWGNDHTYEEEDDFIRCTGADYTADLDCRGDDYSYCLNCSGKPISIRVNNHPILLERDELLVLCFTKKVLRIRRSRGWITEKLVDDEIFICINALVFYTRMFLGQYEQIDHVISDRVASVEPFRKNEHTRKHLLAAIRSRVFINTAIATSGLNASLGIWNQQTDNKARSSYDMQQIMRYHYAYCRTPEGGMTYDFDEPDLRGVLPPIICICEKDGESFIETIKMTGKHVRVLDDALRIYGLCNGHDIRRLFEFFTDDPINLVTADVIGKLYVGVPKDDEYINRIDTLRARILFSGRKRIGKRKV